MESIFLVVELYTNVHHFRFTMADSSESRPVARATKPVSEALLNEKVQLPCPWTRPFYAQSLLCLI